MQIDGNVGGGVGIVEAIVQSYEVEPKATKLVPKGESFAYCRLAPVAKAVSGALAFEVAGLWPSVGSMSK